MKNVHTLAIVVLALSLSQTRVSAQSVSDLVGDPVAGAATYAFGNTSCSNCHGRQAEGAWGPALAGRDLTVEYVAQAVRSSIGRMASFDEHNVTDQEIADMTAFFNGQPPSSGPSAWRVEWPADGPQGQQVAGVIGCLQCHGASISTPRHGAGESGGDFEWFKRMVYQHTATQREQWSQLDPNVPSSTPRPAGPWGRARMGNYSSDRIPESLLEQIWGWMNDLGITVPLVGRLAPGKVGDDGVTYTLTVSNGAIRNKGLTADEVTVALAVPVGASVVAATGASYEGIRKSSSGGDLAVWKVSRLAPGDLQTFTITISREADEELQGTIEYARPVIPSGDVIPIRPAVRRGAGEA
ncbi:MAG TPA: c-type cytochrome [Gammaproteobacteria bacterium]